MIHKQIYFLRHIQTNSNHNCINGQSISVPISSKKSIIIPTTIDIVFCSTAVRCCQTLDCCENLHLAQEVVYTDILLERNMGIFEGKQRDLLIQEYPHMFKGKRFDIKKTPPGGESFEEFLKRVDSFYFNLVASLNNKNYGNVLICSHNQFLKCLYLRLKGVDIILENWRKIDFPNGEIIKIK